MKKSLMIAVMGLVVQLGLMHAAHVVSAEEIKIGSVNFQQALNDVDQGKKSKAALKAEFEAKQKKLAVQQDELKKIQEDAQKQGSVLSQEAMAAKQKAFNEKLAEFQKNMGAYRDELAQKEAKMTGQILQNMKKVVAEIGQQEGFQLIVETSQDAILYAKAKEDLTARVVASYNKKFTGALKAE